MRENPAKVEPRLVYSESHLTNPRGVTINICMYMLSVSHILKFTNKIRASRKTTPVYTCERKSLTLEQKRCPPGNHFHVML